MHSVNKKTDLGLSPAMVFKSAFHANKRWYKNIQKSAWQNTNKSTQHKIENLGGKMLRET